MKVKGLPIQFSICIDYVKCNKIGFRKTPLGELPRKTPTWKLPPGNSLLGEFDPNGKFLSEEFKIINSLPRKLIER